MYSGVEQVISWNDTDLVSPQPDCTMLARNFLISLEQAYELCLCVMELMAKDKNSFLFLI